MTYSPNQPAQSCTVKEVFDVDGISGHGGANLVIDLTRNHLQLPQILSGITLQKAPWATYSIAQDLECLLTAYALGMKRISHMPEFEHDPLLRAKLGLDKLPQQSTIYRTLGRFSDRSAVESLAALNPHFLNHVVDGSRAAILDLDATVNTVYGSQENACVGYNPRYRGRPSYQPLVAFEGQSKAGVHVELRSGKSATAQEKIAFYHASKRQLPEDVRLFAVRADNEFASEPFCVELENDGVGYALKLRKTSGVWDRVQRGVLWKRIDSNETTEIEVGIIGFKADGWSRHRRVVLIRTRMVDEMQPKLFTGLSWDYQAIVTNFDWPAEDVWHFYNQRCTCENHIKELKEGLDIDAISKDGFWPNAADLWIKVFAYNTLLALKQLADSNTQHYSIRRFRRILLQVPALLVRHARQFTIRLPRWWPHQDAWQHLRASLDTS